MSTLFYSTGQAARELGTTQAQVRSLCQTNAIAAEVTDGGQWRISRAELERLKRDGLPPIPRPLPSDNPPASVTRPRRTERELPPYVSDETVAAADEVVRLEAEVQGLGLRRQKEEGLDWFRQREREEVEEQTAAAEEERARIAAEQDQRRREQWLQSWEAYALNSVPYDAPPEVRLEVHRAVRERLAALDPLPAGDVPRQLVDATVARALAPWKRQKEIEAVLLDARDRMLPSEARGSWGELSNWQIRALREAGAAISLLRDNAPAEEIRAALKRAVEKVAADFQADKAARADAETRQRIIQWAPLLEGLTEEGKELAKQAVAEALAKLPQGTPLGKLEEAKEQAMVPFRAAVAQRKAQEQAQQLRNQDQAIRQAVIDGASWKLPFDLRAEQKQPALAAVAKVINALPEFTPEDKLEQARDQALTPFLDAHAQRKRKAQFIDTGLQEIYPYLRKVEDDWDFDGKSTFTLELEIKDSIRGRLDKELSGEESAEQVQTRVQRLVREKLGIERRRVTVDR